jgi:autotransporter-associated beta strand protein
LTLSIALAPTVTAVSVDATVYIYTPDTASSFWTNGTQSGTEWTTGGVVTAPVSNGSNNSSGAILTFGQTSAGVTSDLDSITNVNTFNTAGGTFQCQDINLEGSDPNSQAGSVSINGSSGVGGSTINIVTGNNGSNGIFADANGSNISYNFNANLAMTNNTDVNGAGTATFYFNGNISGAANFYKNDSNGVVVLTYNNSFGAYTASNNSNHGLQVLQGTCQIGNGGTSGTPGNQAANGSIGALITIGSSDILSVDRSDSPTFTNAIFINASSGYGGDLSALAGTSVTFSGPITNNTSAGALYLNNGSSGTINITGTAANGTANNYTTGAQVWGGTVNVFNDQSSATGGWIVGPKSGAAATLNFSNTANIIGASTAIFRVGYNSATGSYASTLNSAGTVTNAGSLIVGRDAALNITSGTWNQSGPMTVIGEGGYNAYVNVLSGGTFNYNGSTAITLDASVSAGSYFAAVNVSGGTFTTGEPFNEVANGQTLPSGTLILSSGGTVTLTQSIASLITQNTTSGSIATPMELGNGSGGIINTAGFNTAIGVVISNLSTQAGTLALTGGGTLTLSADNTYTGSTNISSGNLTAGINSITTGGPFGLNSAVTLANSSTASLVLAGFNATIGSLTGGGSSGGNVNLGSGTLTVGSDNTSPAAYAGSIFGTGGLTKTGTGAATLSGSNSYSGPTKINTGTLAFAQRLALYGGNTSSWTASNITVASGATLDVNIGGTGEFISSDLDTLIALGTGTGGFQSGSTIQLDTTNATTGFTYNTSITNPGGNTLNLTKIGINTLTLNGTNSYTGVTSVIAGTLVLTGNDTAATGGFNILPSTSNSNTATLNLGAGALFDISSPATVSIGNLAASGNSNAATINTGIGTVVNNTGSLLIQRNGYLNVVAGATWNQSGAITVYPGVATSYGSYLNVNGTFNYTGSTAIAINPSGTRAGSSIITITGTFNTSAGFTAAASSNTGTGTLAISGGTLALNSSAGIGVIAASPLLVTVTGNATIDTTNSPGTNTISSPITGTGGLTKVGPNTLTLSGASTYNGSTAITGGSLLAGAASSLSPNSAINIAGGTLNTSGYANTIPSLTVTSGALDLGSGNVLGVTGSATLSGTLNLIGFSYTSTPETLMTYASESGTFTTTTGVPTGDIVGYNSSSLVLEVGHTGPANLTWDNAGGTGNGTSWDTTSQNWNNGSAATTFSNTSNTSNGDNVTFNDSNNAHYNVIVTSAGVTPNTITVNTAATYNLSGGSIGGGGGLTLTAGTLNVANTTQNAWGSTTVNGGTLILANNTALPINQTLTIASGATVQVTSHSGGPSNVTVLQVGTLNNSGTIDLTNNSLAISSGSTVSSITTEVKAAYNGGSWTGTSSTGGVITSTTAAADTTYLTAVGVATGLTSFDGITVPSTDILVKYTYYGDTNLDGAVDGSDYTNIDNGFNNHLTGWQNGDFNYDSIVDGSDYTLIDNAYNMQGNSYGTNSAALIASATAQIAGPTSAVPEPTTLGLLGIGAVGLLARRRRKHSGN